MWQLLLAKIPEKIRLVFVWIRTGVQDMRSLGTRYILSPVYSSISHATHSPRRLVEEPSKRSIWRLAFIFILFSIYIIYFSFLFIFAFCFFLFALNSRIMPSRYKIRSFFHGPIVKRAELDAFIAHDVRIRRAAGLVFGDHIVDHFSLVFLFEIKSNKRNIQSGGHAHRIEPVFSPITIHPIRLPDFYKNAGDTVSGLFQNRGRNRAIDAAGHADKDFFSLTFHIAYDIKVSRKPQQKALYENTFGR